MTIGHVYTLKQAAKLTGVSHSTIRRRHAEGEFPNAYKDSEGVWKIPLSDLEQAGIRPRSAERAHGVSTSSAPVTLTSPKITDDLPSPPVSAGPDLTVELRDLRLEVERWRSEAGQAKEDLAEMRGYVRGVEGTLEESKLLNRELSARNRDLTQALIALEPARPAQPVTVVGETMPAQPSYPETVIVGGINDEQIKVPAPEPAPKKRWWQW